MATYVNDGDINWNGNWQTTGKADALHASTTVESASTTPQYSGTWNGNAANTDIGVLAFLHSFDANATGTLTVGLQQDAGGGSWSTVASTTLAFNANLTKGTTWVYFKFAGSHAETAGTNNYRIAFTNSGNTSNGVQLRVDNSATTKVAIIQVLSATNTLVAGDVTYVCGICQAAASNPASNTVTVNVNANGTGYGTINIGSGGILAFSTAAATTTYLEVAGDITVYTNGTFQMGTTGTPIPVDSVATLEFNNTSAARTFNAALGSILSIQGFPKFGGSPQNFRTVLSQTANASQPVLACDLDVQAAGWAANDTVMIQRTGVTRTTTEYKTIQSVSGNGITLSTNLANAHASGAEVVNLSRNAVLTATSAAHANNVWLVLRSTAGNGTADIDYCRVEWFGQSTANSGCVHMVMNSNASLDNSAFYEVGSSAGANRVTMVLCGDNKTYENLAVFQTATTNCNHAIFLDTGYNQVLNNVSIAQIGNPSYFASGVVLWDTQVATGKTSATLNGVHVYDQTNSTTVKAFDVYGPFGGLVLNNCKAFGMNKNASDAAVGCQGWNTGYGTGVFVGRNCCFGSDGTNVIANTRDVDLSNATNFIQAKFYNCQFNSAAANEIVVPGSSFKFGWEPSCVSSQRHKQVSGWHKSVQTYGIISDQVTGGQAASWARGGDGICVYLDPNSTTQPLEWNFFVPVAAATPFQLLAYVKTTQTVNGPMLTCTVYDSHDDYTVLLNAESVDLSGASDWILYTSSQVTPTDTGFCRVIFKCLNGSSTGDVGIDDISTV